MTPAEQLERVKEAVLAAGVSTALVEATQSAARAPDTLGFIAARHGVVVGANVQWWAVRAVYWAAYEASVWSPDPAATLATLYRHDAVVAALAGEPHQPGKRPLEWFWRAQIALPDMLRRRWAAAEIARAARTQHDGLTGYAVESGLGALFDWQGQPLKRPVNLLTEYARPLAAAGYVTPFGPVSPWVPSWDDKGRPTAWPCVSQSITEAGRARYEQRLAHETRPRGLPRRIARAELAEAA